ncbi:hypothetical protein [Acidithrix sp. C25]|uniref:hypothetical protein n=1 Tax=Acidithrix sp. C25 TaxID=1671482 RepID=UPI00191BB84C|nr:hypothetical protein [Acidithrix sp. C25]
MAITATATIELELELELEIRLGVGILGAPRITINYNMGPSKSHFEGPIFVFGEPKDTTNEHIASAPCMGESVPL